jgi:hypothetical protein
MKQFVKMCAVEIDVSKAAYHIDFRNMRRRGGDAPMLEYPDCSPSASAPNDSQGQVY